MTPYGVTMSQQLRPEHLYIYKNVVSISTSGDLETWREHTCICWNGVINRGLEARNQGGGGGQKIHRHFLKYSQNPGIDHRNQNAFSVLRSRGNESKHT